MVGLFEFSINVNGSRQQCMCVRLFMMLVSEGDSFSPSLQTFKSEMTNHHLMTTKLRELNHKNLYNPTVEKMSTESC